MATWICTDCGALHDANDPPCSRCAGDLLAKLPEDAESSKQIERDISVKWRCKSCGADHLKNSPPCDNCGGLQFEPIYQSHAPASDPTGTSDDASGNETLFYIGAVLGVVGVIIFPYFFFLIALPEAIYKWRGGSIQNHLPGEASTNAGVRGSMLIIGWFGNFLWLLIGLAFVVGFFLAF